MAMKTQSEVKREKSKQAWWFGGAIILLFVLFLSAFLVQANRYETAIDVLNVTIGAQDDVIKTQDTRIKDYQHSENHFRHILRGIPQNIDIQEFDWSDRALDSLVNRKKFNIKK